LKGTVFYPQQLAVILTNLSDEVEALTGTAEKVNYFSDHPFTPQRADYINKSSVKIDWTPREPIAADRRQFLSKFDGMYFGGNPAQGVFQKNNFLHPDLGIFMKMPDEWTRENNPQAVAAADKEGNGLVYLTVPDTIASPAALGKLLENRFSEKGIGMDRSESTSINGNDAYLISASESTKDGNINLTIVFVSVNQVVYQLVGVATDQLKDVVAGSLGSIRSLNEQERNSITALVLRIEAAEEGESLDAFNSRTGNEWNTSFTALMNNIQEDVLLSEGQYLKTVRSEKYIKN
jgi:predicted Zn-dependent protease